MNNIKLMDGEVFKDIEGYEGLYQISNKGRVYSKRKNLFKRSSGRDKNDNHQRVILYKEGTRKTLKVHRLVGFSFVPNDDPTNKTQIHHLDFNPKNNCSDNIKWVSPKEHIKIHREEKKNKGQLDERIKGRLVIS